MQITKEQMYQSLLLLLLQFFRRPGAERAQIRDVIIVSSQETDKIRQGVDACYHDILSDIDISLYTSDPEPICPEQLGFTRELLLGLSRQEETLTDSRQYTLFRVILKNGMRYDIGIYQPDSQKPIERTQNTIVKSTAETTQKTAAGTAAEATKQAADLAVQLEKADSFWFIAVQALAKLYRRDYLIADHLTNLLINETLVIQMIERDKQYGTTIHRYGYAEKLAYRENTEKFFQCLLNSETFLYIADRLFHTAAAYDRLSSATNPAYEERRAVFYELWSCYNAGINLHCSSDEVT